MVKHIQGKDGKMAGSIGDGKVKIPKASDVTRSAAATVSEPDSDLNAMYALFKDKDGVLTADEYATAVARAQAAATAYYDGDGSVLYMTDAEYDVLVDQIATFEQAHPTQAITHGLTSAVAGGASAGGDVAHPHPMLSLDKVTNDPAGMARFVDQATAGGETVVVEPKMDGMAVRAVYENGRLVQLVTRGDGNCGEDVTAQYANIDGEGISGLPADVGDSEFTGEVRGEVYMTSADFDASNEARMAAGKPAFANERNATAGSLRRGDPEYAVHMSFAAYGADLPDRPAGDHAALMAELDQVGFRSAQSLMPGYDPARPEALTETGPAGVQRRIAALQDARDGLGFPIDGAVVSVNRLGRRDELGIGSRTPRWALAYKYPAEEVTSVLRDVEVTIGRTGRLSLTARIDPVEVGGVTITKATLHNVSWMEAENLGVGSRVSVKRAGDVIPRVTSALGGTDTSTVTPWRAPDVCPQCGEPWDKSTLLWRCRGGCGAAPAVSFAMSRDVLDVDGGGDVFANAAVNAGIVNDVADLYSLTVPQVAALTGEDGRQIGERNAVKIVDGIQRAKGQSVARHLTSLNIRTLGRTLGRRLASHFGTLDAVRNASLEDLEQVDGVGSEKARFIYDGMRAKSTVIDRLVAAGINTGTAPAASAAGPAGAAAPSASDVPLTGKTVVVTGAMTGALSALRRNDMNELIEAKGGKSSGSVSANTSLLVCGEPGSSKFAKAQQLGIPIMTPEEFAALISYT
jgi:DNA ligase (NAD+)